MDGCNPSPGLFYGIFHPPILVNGQVSGLWNRTIQKNKVIVELDFFHSQDEVAIRQINKKVNMFGKFLANKLKPIVKLKKLGKEWSGNGKSINL